MVKRRFSHYARNTMHYPLQLSADVAQLVEHFHGKEKVTGSIPVIGSKDFAASVSFLFVEIKGSTREAKRSRPRNEVKGVPVIGSKDFAASFCVHKFY